jgi:hypothetical protein
MALVHFGQIAYEVSSKKESFQYKHGLIMSGMKNHQKSARESIKMFKKFAPIAPWPFFKSEIA